MIQTAENYKKALAENLIIDDWQAIDILLAAVIAHKIDGEMVWLRLIGSAGTGKTEILISFSSLDGYCAKVESLTPSSIRRGFVIDSDDERKMPTLLERINGKLVITKELAPLLTANRELKLEVFGLLRSVHDGEVIADYGSRQGHISQSATFDWILGSTRYIDRQSALDAQLGSRFIDLRWGAPLNRKAAVIKAMSNDGTLPAIRGILAKAMRDLIALPATPDQCSCDNLDMSYLSDVANFVSTYRTPVERDTRDKELILDIPDAELGTRVGQAFARLVKGMLLIGLTDYKPYVRRLAFDCLPPLRSACVKALLKGCRTEAELGQAMGVSHVTAHYTKEDLKYLGLNQDTLSIIKGGE